MSSRFTADQVLALGDDYRDHLPAGRDVVLAIEVSVSTLKKDQRKLPILARAGVPTVWILDVVGRRLLVHTENLGDRYGSVLELTDAEAVEVLCWACDGPWRR